MSDRLDAIIRQAIREQYPKSQESEHHKAYRESFPQSEGEELFYCQWKAYSGLPVPEREVELVPGRKWRSDFVWKAEKLVVEIEGGVYARGRHVRGKGFTDDVRKYRETEKRGYRVLRFTTEMVKTWEAFNETVREYQVRKSE